MSISSDNLIPFTGTLQAGQRLMKHSDGTFIPVGVTEPGGGAVEPVAGYAINTSGVITFQDLEGSTPESVSSIKIVDTGVEEPDYPSAGGTSENTELLMHFDNSLIAEGTNLSASETIIYDDGASVNSLWTYQSGEEKYPEGKFSQGLMIPKSTDEYDDSSECLILPINFKFHESSDLTASPLIPATFTIEFFIKLLDSTQSSGRIMYCADGKGGNYRPLMDFSITNQGNNTWQIIYYDCGIFNYALWGTFTNDGTSFNHIAVVQTSENKSLYIDGISVASKTSLGSNNSYSQCPIIFGSVPGAVFDELRISNIARYTSNFTPPTVPFVID